MTHTVTTSPPYQRLVWHPAGGEQRKKGSRVTIVVGKFEPPLNPEPTPTPEATTTPAPTP